MANCINKGLKVWPKVLLYGDSITQQSFSPDGCWGSLLADYLQRKCDVVTRGFSGYTTRWCKLMLPSILDKTVAKDTVAMTIFLGANDSNNEANVRQHVPLEEYKENMKEMVDYALSTGMSRERIILIAPPAFNVSAWAEDCKKKGKVVTKDNTTTGVYAKACCELAQEMGTGVVDLYTEMMKAEDFTQYLNDGLHLSPSGSRLLFSLLQPIIERLTADLPLSIFPFYDQVDLDNLEKSLLE
ncbi:isoamyl acetate-hydrolyzing esterase 1 homolog [Aplysia californica]|uniref:Isoamyl acetate-hydrolyzing esterase 1 homolog n=1 Tax=Aplysia californica TaxID=6500 RepID=A0ABM0K9G6_APLCA|nr:isoamyl acetate-hydrolyzing esterase 1 homolog [Aplysia californica]